ncbi:hypothetical protein J8F10_19480 [Gemmata sp. G18]|uniref:Uncharacterized protein n=1 Tax=Gemmata palustris TaxID=2822762 RepID=A0ABS5BUP0_9BACT|nr:hypothetical protein [Gemmata palustris]MBP3957434.1 hypothetical protein [Gemmata palustris]
MPKSEKMTGAELRKLVDVKQLKRDISEFWEIILDDAQLFLYPEEPTQAIALLRLLEKAADKLPAGAIRANLTLVAKPSREYKITTDEGVEEGVAGGKSGLDGEVHYPGGKTVTIRVIWVSHPFYQYRPISNAPAKVGK